jgi:hypothetical protein
MTTITVNIEKQSVSINGQTCNFIEAGLTNNLDPVETLVDSQEIEEVLIDQNEGKEISVIFES